jgi:hypothetical protein
MISSLRGAAALLGMMVLPASAWEYSSVASGMTVEQAAQVLAGQNKRLTLFSERSEENPGDVYLVEPDSAMLVHVCNGVVNGYSDILPGAIETFVARAATEAKARGPGQTHFVSANEGAHQLNKMRIEWMQPGGSQLSLNWSSLNGVNYATIAIKAVCAPANTGAAVANDAGEAVRAPSATGAVAAAPVPTSTEAALSLAQKRCAAKFRSFDPKTGNYRDYKGRTRRCDLLAANGNRRSASR